MFIYRDVSPMYDAILDRVCSHILSRICDNIEIFCLDASIMERVLLAYKYSNLFNLTIADFCPETALQCLTGTNIKLSWIRKKIYL